MNPQPQGCAIVSIFHWDTGSCEFRIKQWISVEFNLLPPFARKQKSIYGYQEVSMLYLRHMRCCFSTQAQTQYCSWRPNAKTQATYETGHAHNLYRSEDGKQIAIDILIQKCAEISVQIKKDALDVKKMWYVMQSKQIKQRWLFYPIRIFGMSSTWHSFS